MNSIKAELNIVYVRRNAEDNNVGSQDDYSPIMSEDGAQRICGIENMREGYVPVSDVKIVVDDAEIASFGFFDIIEFMCVRKQGETFAYLFSCECGVPECAGINEPIVVTATHDNVTWQFNPDGAEVYRKLKSATGTNELVFSRQDYDEATLGLYRQIKEAAHILKTDIILNPEAIQGEEKFGNFARFTWSLRNADEALLKLIRE